MGVTRRLGFAIASLQFAVCGCAGMFRAPAAPAWVEVSSEHFVVESDLDVESATSALERFETFREALEQVAFPSESQPGGRTRVVLFETEDEYREIGPQASDGFFTRAGTLLDPEPRVVLYAEGGYLVEALQHELVHRYVAFHLPAAPIWLNEGLAYFYSTLEIRDGKAIVGAPTSNVRYGSFTNVTDGTFFCGGECAEVLRDAPPIVKLTEMGAREFYGWKLNESGRSLMTMAAHLGAAWALTHVLEIGDRKRHDHFLSYLDLLKAGSLPAREAWKVALGQDEQELTNAVIGLLNRGEIDIGKVDFAPPARPRATVRSMTAAEVHRLWAQLRPWSTPRSRARARQDIDFALRLVPDDPKTLVVLGYWSAANGDLRSAEASLKRAATVAPRSPEVLAAIANFYFAIEEMKTPKARDFASLEGWVESLEPLADAPRQWNFIAWYWAMRKQPARGIEYARRTVREDSACAECYDTLALLLSQEGAVFDAVQAQRVAVNLSESEDSDMLRRLEQFERDLLALNRQVSPPPKSVVDEIAALGAYCEKAVPLSTPAPAYPAVAQKNDVRGDVRARFVIREDGSVTDVVATSGPALLAAAAVSAIGTWRFSPARCAGREVVSAEEARIPFSLRNR